MNSDVHRHQAHPPLAQHGVHGAAQGVGPCGWYSSSAAPAPTAPARLKRTQPPHQLPSGVGLSGPNGPHAPLSPTALQASIPHNSVMSSSVRAPAASCPAQPSMHTSQITSVTKGPSDVLVNSTCVQNTPAANHRHLNMSQRPWHHGAISRERAEALLSVSADGVFLVRESTNFPGDHTLCVRYKGRVEHYRIKWVTSPDVLTQRLTIDDEEFFDDMTDLIQHYLKDADGLCTKLVKCLPKLSTPNGGNMNGAIQPPQPPYNPPPPPAPQVTSKLVKCLPKLSTPNGGNMNGAIQPPQPPYNPPPPPAPQIQAPPYPVPPATVPVHTYSTQAPSTDHTDSAAPPPKFANTLCIIAERDLEIRENIGKGEFGDVMLGILNGNQKVAVKILKDREAANKFIAEASVMATLKHENLVRLLGLVLPAGGNTCIVTEHCAQGSLLDFLRSRGRHYVTQLHQINFAYDACLGMEYLERMRVVHRDLAARNVLLCSEGRAKVADFGLARDLHDSHALDPRALHAKLPIKWTAPEALKYNKFSNKSDMWSFGILLWEIYSFGRVPYPRISLAEVVKHVERGYRMEAPEGCPAPLYELMSLAWHADAAARPAFSAMRARLAALRAATPSPPNPPAAD